MTNGSWRSDVSKSPRLENGLDFGLKMKIGKLVIVHVSTWGVDQNIVSFSRSG